MSLADLTIFFVFIAGGAYWWQAQGIKQLALAAVADYCRRVDVQFLDHSIVLKGFWVKRDRRGNPHLWRSYLFEFTSTGEKRYQGRIILLGREIERIELETHRLH